MPPDFIYTWSETGMFLMIALVTGAIALAIHLLLCLPAMRRLSERVSDLSPVLQALCGTLFVLSVTFLANTVWQAEDRARETVNEEARNLRVIHTYLGAMTGPSRDGFNKLLAAYGAAVAAEWPDMMETNGSAAAERQLAETYRATIQGFAEGDQNRLLQQRILAALDGLSTARQRRLTMTQEFVSAGQWFTVTALALLLMAVIALCHGRFAAARAVALAAVTLAITISLSEILAHDRPFVGHLAITPQAIIDAAGN